MQRGKKTPDNVVDFIIKTKKMSPDLSNYEIAQRVRANYPDIEIDRTTVGNKLNSNKPKWQQQVRSVTKSPNYIHDQIKKHHDTLLAVMDEFQGLSVFPPRGDELEKWLSMLDEPRWPITQGYVCRDERNKLTVKLFMDDQIEWEYLQQHLTGDPVWQAIEDWKSAMAEDVMARRELYEEIRQKVISETNLDISSELSLKQAGGNVLSSYYVHILYDQVFSNLIGIRLSAKRREEFFIQDDYSIKIAGYVIAAVSDVEKAEDVINFLLDAQKRFTKLPAAKSAAVAYQRAEESTQRLKRELRRILLAPGLPPDSRCDGCRAWF